ncbi:aldehyde dehydrogenase family protein, partial [Rhizobium johnstonii]
MRRFQHYIDGEFSYGEACYPSIYPASGAVWAEMPEAREGDVDRAVNSADKALYEGPWPKLTATQRGQLVKQLA